MTLRVISYQTMIAMVIMMMLTMTKFLQISGAGVDMEHLQGYQVCQTDDVLRKNWIGEIHANAFQGLEW